MRLLGVLQFRQSGCGIRCRFPGFAQCKRLKAGGLDFVDWVLEH